MVSYEHNANVVLARMNVSFSFKLMEPKCPIWRDSKEHSQGNHYLVTFSRNKKRINFHYHGSTNDKRLGKNPTTYDVIACLTKYDPINFRIFCSTFGYDDDSIKANEIYKGVVAEWKKVSKFFSQDELDELREIE